MQLCSIYIEGDVCGTGSRTLSVERDHVVARTHVELGKLGQKAQRALVMERRRAIVGSLGMLQPEHAIRF